VLDATVIRGSGSFSCRGRVAARIAAIGCELLLAGALIAVSVAAQPGRDTAASLRDSQQSLRDVGLPLGTEIPAFRALDQDGRLRDFASVSGPNGAVIYFYRSAAWCIYCRSQLIETEAAREGLRRNGLGVVGVSYDAPDVLKRFSDEHDISYPLLSDRDSSIIKAFEVLDVNAPPGSPAHGVSYHGTYVVDSRGVIVAKLFDAEATLTHSTGLVVSKLFGSPVNTHAKTVTHERLSLTYYASSNYVAAGAAVDLIVEVRLNDGMHVYPPQNGPYVPIDLQIEASSAFDAQPQISPPTELSLTVEGHDPAQIYVGQFDVSRRISVLDASSSSEAIDPQGNFVIKGVFRFQACDSRICYLPTSIPLKWNLRVAPPSALAEHGHH
jgi:peroxiredoxin